MTYDVALYTRGVHNNGYVAVKPVRRWNLLPESNAKPQPSFIPSGIVEDYTEACRIQALSPKASATLARRCLQGMIRDFCKISRGTLFEEIKELRDQVANGTAERGVTHESVDAIDAVRKIGNIGAHMEKDVDLIVPIDEGEANVLIQLIETLFEDWYVQREERKRRFAAPLAIAAQKEAEKKQLTKQAKPALPPPSDLKM